MPLLRNREIDERRAGLAQARIGRRIADLSIDQQRLLIRQLAISRYWNWVASGERLRIASDLLRVASERDQALREAAELGSIAGIEVTENQRQILQRRSQIIESERDLQQAAIALSLFYRDAAGNPAIARPAQLPHAPARPPRPLSDDQVEEDLSAALEAAAGDCQPCGAARSDDALIATWPRTSASRPSILAWALPPSWATERCGAGRMR